MQKYITLLLLFNKIIIMDIFKDAEKYLMNKQVYFRKEIVNKNFGIIAEAKKVHNVKDVEIIKLDEKTIAFNITINNVETTIYEQKTEAELFAWIKKNLIPVEELVNKWFS